MLTNEELATAIQNGDQHLMNQLWEQCYGFIRQQAVRWRRAWQDRPDFEVDDLTQAGYLALCDAVNGFQADKGGFLAILAFYLKTEFSKVAGCRTEAQRREPLNNAASLDAPAYKDEDSETTLGDSIPVCDQGFDDVESEIFHRQLATVLDDAMSKLPEKQRQAIKLYYLDGLQYVQIAEVLRCTASRVGQLTEEGRRGLRNGSYAPTLSEMLYGERNYFRGTSYGAWKHSGCSSPEMELLQKEGKRQRNIEHCVSVLGMTRERAERIFSA